MASTHKSLRSGTANKRPTTSIADGQIALNTNTTSPGLFFKDSTGATIIKVGPVHVGTTAPNASPAAGGSSGNSTGEVWLDTSLTPNGVKIWNGASWTNATPIGSTTVQGLLELATNAETQTGTDPDRAVTPAGLQSKVSDSTSTTSSTTIASSTAVKSAYDLANAALPKSGGTVTGNLEIGTTGSLSFEGATADAFETTIAVVDPTADRTITLPDTTGTVVTTGDTGTVTSTMIADGTIVDGDISASAEIAVSKLADGAARQLLQTDAAGTGVEWASNIDVPGTLDVTSTATFDSIASHPLGSAAAPTLTFTGDTNTGIYSPGADQVAISTGGSGRLFVDASGNVGVGVAAPDNLFHINQSATSGTNQVIQRITTAAGGAFFIRCSDLSAAAPSWEIYTGASEDIRFSPGASERLRITSAGLVGVGTSTPQKNFVVSNGGAQGIEFAAAESGLSRMLVYNRSTSAYAPLNIEGSTIQFVTGTGNNALFIDSSQRVGIGTSSPSGYIHIQGTSTGTETYGRFTTGGASGDQSLVIKSGSSRDHMAIQVSTNAGVADDLALQPDGGRVGIGTQSPLAKLVVSESGENFEFVSGNATLNGGIIEYVNRNTASTRPDFNYYIGGGSGGSHKFYTSGTERARIDSSGRLLVGTSSTFYSTEHKAYFAGDSNSNSGSIVVGRFQATQGGSPDISLVKSRGTSIGTNTIVSSGDEIGRISFRAADGTNYTQAAEIRADVDGTPGTNDMPGRLVFSVTADGASSPTERARITSQGLIVASNTGAYYGTVSATNFHSFDQASAQWTVGLRNTQTTQPYGIIVNYTAATPNNTVSDFVYCLDSSATRMAVRSNGGIANYQSNDVNLCDEREKKNIETLDSTWDCLKHWELKKFHYNADEDTDAKRYGVIAQQVEEHCPEVISEWIKQKAEPAKLDDEGNELEPAKEEIVRMGVKEQQMYWMAIKALQEAQVRIEALEAEVAALKAQ